MLDDLSSVLAWSSLPLAERRLAFALACTAKIPAVPPTTASMTDAASAATAGFRLHQSHARSAGPTRRAAIGRESSQDAQVVGQGMRRGVPPPRVLRQAFQADRLEIARDVWIEVARRIGRPLLHGLQRVDQAVAAEGGLAGQERVEDRAEAIDVGRRRDRAAPPRRLLR